MSEHYDVVVVGGGIIGLATARAFLRDQPDLKLAVLDKERELAAHQSGHNSGVIHAGIYYKPGSLKAQASVAGHREIMAYCEEHGLPYRRCGKVIVALNEEELPRLHELHRRGLANGVRDLRLIGPEELREIEPHAEGVQALHSPHTGVTDYRQIALAYAREIREAGGEIKLGCQVHELVSRHPETILQTTQGDVRARYVVTTAGLYSDRISSAGREMRVIPFRGSYYKLRPERADLCRALIYPVPDPAFPFLGVHFTRTLDDEVWVGPNAVLAFAREAYQRWQIHPGELWATLSYPGLWKLAARYWRMGALEMYRDYVKAAYVKTAQAYIAALTADDLVAGPSGVRAQVVTLAGDIVDDFLIRRGENVIHVQNAPSPAATSSLVIGRMILERAKDAFELSV